MTNENTNQDPDITEVLGLTSSSGPKRHLKRWFGWGTTVLLIVLAIIYWTGNKNASSLQFKTQAVEQGDLTVTVTATGTLEPTNQVDVGSELSGIIETVEVDYNDLVGVGQVLARLDTSKLEAEVMKSQAALDAAGGNVLQVKSTVTETRTALTRIKYARELTHNKAPSQDTLDAAEASFQRAQADLICAKAQVTEAQATLEYNQTDLSKAIIRSPINGIVLSRDVDPGQTVAASFSAPVLFTLAEDLTQMELHVDVDEADVSQVKEDQHASFTVDAYPDRTFPATLRQVRYGAQTTDGVVTYETVLSVDNTDLLLRPGMTATADITVKKIEQAILVPNTALRFTPPATEIKSEKSTSGIGGFVSKLMPPKPGGHRSPSNENQHKSTDHNQQVVWSLNADSLVSIAVTIGVTDGTMTQVTSGDLTPGMALVVDTVSVSK